MTAPPSDVSKQLDFDYELAAGARDEMITVAGGPSAAWEKLLRRVEEIGPLEINRRQDETRRLIRESGLVGVSASLWDLDPIPLLITPGEWARLSDACIQRATLLNRVLQDLYGQQVILREGAVPAAMILAHRAFLRAVHGLPIPQGRFLHLYSMDVVRTADGWQVIDDGTQAPEGIGIALENRIHLQRMMPELHQAYNVTRLPPFFRALRETLSRLAVRHTDNPRLALLTPGPEDPLYYEHVYLARYVGALLVEGGDLTVRDAAVWVKTLGGLLPVDVLIRRAADYLCDPLDLQGNSTLGAAGLVEAVRAGSTVTANALGTGLLDSPMLAPFLPSLCRRLLGEDLKLASARALWLGEDHARDHVLESMNEWVLQEALAPGGEGTLIPRMMPEAAREELRQRVLLHGERFVAQQVLEPSSAPAWRQGRLTPAPFALRLFALATPDGYTVMPGGIARMAPDTAMLQQADNIRGGLKDVWVISEKPASAPSMLQMVARDMPLLRSGMDIPSRVADDLFWLGRYAERTEGSIRLVRSVVNRLTADAAMEELPELRPLLSVLMALDLAPPGSILDDLSTQEVAGRLLQVVYSRDQPGNLRFTVDSLKRTAAAVRDRISLDAWRTLSGLVDLTLPEEDDVFVALADSIEAMDSMVLLLAGFSGFVMESMTRGPAWKFLDMGRRIERAHHMNALLRAMVAVPDAGEPSLMQALLEIGDSAMTYRSRYLSSLQPPAVLDLLLMDETNPRSTAYQIVALNEHVQTLRTFSPRAERDQEERLVLEALTMLRVASAHTLAAENEEGAREALATLLDRLETAIPEVSNALSNRYFAHAEGPRPLGGVWTWGAPS